MALNRSDKSRILRRYFPGMTRNSEMSTEPSEALAEDTYTFMACTLGPSISELSSTNTAPAKGETSWPS